MYTIFGANRTLKIALAVYAVLIALIALGFGRPESVATLVRWALVSAGLFMAVTALLAGTSNFHALWRMAFRKWPKLNEWIYPDLNGVWYGNTTSNWKVIEQLRQSASGKGGLDLTSLHTVPLMTGEIAMEIKAGLFGINIRSKVSDTGGESITLSCRADKSEEDRNYRLSYLYRQDTSEPACTDEGSHEGAAMLKVIFGDMMSLEGFYWTRRKWREGMNTAGKINVVRVSDRHAPNGVDLLENARELASS